MNRKIGILGGTFDPPHYGHLKIAETVLEQLKLDEIWFIPTGNPPHKLKTSHITNENRLQMLQLMVENTERYKVKTIELNKEGKSYSYETMKELSSLYPHNKFYFIIGGDMIETLSTWHKIDELLKLVTFVGVNRPNYSSLTSYPVMLVNIDELSVSSTEIRRKLKGREDVSKLTSPAVLAYIKEHHLYEL